MYRYENIRDLHLEITSRCQASCPMCIRNFHGGGKNSLLELHDWTLEDFKTRIPVDLLEQLEGFYFCGNLGDPIINTQLVDMISYAKSINNTLYIRVHTNGGARNAKFWQDLAIALPDNHLVTFSLDGLDDTHSLYRIGTKYQTVLSNAKTFINAGGKAEWSFIRFKHNEHQVEQAREIALNSGFKSFAVKNTSRFIVDEKFKVINTDQQVTHYLETPTEMTSSIITQEMIDAYEDILDSAKIICPVQKEKSLYIDCRGILYPCCWIASLPWTENKGPAQNVKQHMLDQYQKFLEYFRGTDNIHTSKVSIKNILETRQWKEIEKFLWHNDKFLMCARSCSQTDIDFMKATKQRIKVEAINE